MAEAIVADPSAPSKSNHAAKGWRTHCAGWLTQVAKGIGEAYEPANSDWAIGQLVLEEAALVLIDILTIAQDPDADRRGNVQRQAYRLHALLMATEAMEEVPTRIKLLLAEVIKVADDSEFIDPNSGTPDESVTGDELAGQSAKVLQYIEPVLVGERRSERVPSPSSAPSNAGTARDALFALDQDIGIGLSDIMQLCAVVDENNIDDAAHSRALVNAIWLNGDHIRKTFDAHLDAARAVAVGGVA